MPYVVTHAIPAIDLILELVLVDFSDITNNMRSEIAVNILARWNDTDDDTRKTVPLS
jgi:hypothetical protein